jgi:hypothetical protein
MITRLGANNACDFLFWFEIHHNCWEFFEAENKIFLDLLDIVVAGTEHDILKVILNRVTEDDITLESPV